MSIYKKVAFLCMVFLVLFLTSFPGSHSESMLVMNFNLLTANDQVFKAHPWSRRQPVVVECIRTLAPDIMGTQEGLYSQITQLARDLPEYAWIGRGRNGGNKGEFMAIFFRKDRFEPLEQNHFWLSDTPEVAGSSSWGNNCRRMVTWARFLDHQTNQQFYYFNTHLDDASKESRKKSAELIRKRILDLNTELPVILGGDFNDKAEKSETYKILTAGKFLKDTWLTALQRGDRIGSHHHFIKPKRKGKRIDWILTRGKLTVEKAEIHTFSKDGQYPSDHFPYVTRLKL